MCVRGCVRVCVRACVCVRVRARVRVCACVCQPTHRAGPTRPGPSSEPPPPVRVAAKVAYELVPRGVQPAHPPQRSRPTPLRTEHLGVLRVLVQARTHTRRTRRRSMCACVYARPGCSQQHPTPSPRRRRSRGPGAPIHTAKLVRTPPQSRFVKKLKTRQTHRQTREPATKSSDRTQPLDCLQSFS